MKHIRRALGMLSVTDRRALEAWRMRGEGMLLRTIGHAYGINASNARKLVTKGARVALRIRLVCPWRPRP